MPGANETPDRLRLPLAYPQLLNGPRHLRDYEMIFVEAWRKKEALTARFCVAHCRHPRGPARGSSRLCMGRAVILKLEPEDDGHAGRAMPC